MTNGWQYYGTKTLQMVPYMPGAPAYIDATMPYIYASLKKENKIAAMFCGENKNQDEFISYYQRIKTAQIACRVKENLRLDPVGITWLDLPRGVDGARACHCGMAFFGDSTRTEDAYSLARLALAYCFEDMKIDVLHGVQLESNTMARNFALNLGFEEVAIVPRWHCVEVVFDNELVSARVMMLEKIKFMPAFTEWFEKQEPAIKKP